MTLAEDGIIPAFLSPGDPVAVLSPSGPVDPRRLEAGLEYLRRHGHEPLMGANVLARHGYLAGPDEVRGGDFNDILALDAPRAILMSRGGYGLTRILDRIDIEWLRRRPRLLLGYSDMTALAMALQRRGPYLVHYGPSVSELGEPGAFDERSLWDALYGRSSSIEHTFRASDVLRPGKGAGLVLGGCLSLLVSLLGTPHDPDYRGAILFWEEINEEPYRIDRMLTQLRNAGKLDHLRGMVIGSLTGCEPREGRPSLTVKDVVLELGQVAAFPIVWNFRAGHVPGKRTILLGVEGALNTSLRRLVYRIPGHRRPRQRLT
ncbi:MAG TPA: LD-carboxypeptidase [Candidatus Polarisedimenticolia bacterium]|nr:LD-carboxypeptidase [Candidatus Polarisedimenticolia bacterium]